MKTTILKYITVTFAAGAMLLAGCNDLDQEPTNKFTDKAFWTSPERANMVLMKAIIADSANRTGFGSKQRVKYESVSNLIKHMFACSVSGAKSANCYFGSSSGGGYILVNPNP